MKTRWKNLTPNGIKIYKTLSRAKNRCTNKNNVDYPRYGARGIRYRLEDGKSRIEVVLEQIEAYEEAQRKFPNEKISINRIDNDGDYVLGNVEWTSLAENTRQMFKDNKNNPNMQNGVRAMWVAAKKPVVCITTGEKFLSMREASKQTGISEYGISDCCRGVNKSAGKTPDGRKRVWRYL